MTQNVFDLWRENQECIYQRDFVEKIPLVREAGFIPDPAVGNEMGGFIACLRFGDKLERWVGDQSARLAAYVPSLVYRPQRNIHTTLCTLGVVPGRIIEPMGCDVQDFFDLQNLASLAEAQSGEINKILPFCKINYNRWLLNQTTAVLAGDPNVHVHELASLLTSTLLLHDQQAKISWGSHITVSRFCDRIQYTEELAEAVQGHQGYLTCQCPGEVSPTSLDVGFFMISRPTCGFYLRTWKAFPLA